ncbi:unnamed protein product [Heterobilharzia americana]|nr:unnamed protein product [Heterobilharzia americana]
MIIQAGANINALDSGGNTALHHAAMSGNKTNVSMLLASGVDVDIANKNGWTPLFNAVYWNHPAVTEMLLTSGSSPFIKNKNGRIPLHELCRTKSKESTKILENLELILKYMSKCKQKELFGNAEIESISNGHKTTSNNLVKGIEMDNMSLRSCSQNDCDSEADFTPLLFACYHGHLELVKTLLDRGVDVAATDKNHWTALHWAAQRCHADIVEVLLDYGASIYAKDLRGCMPYAVTSDLGLQECLLPDVEYPNIISNGHVTTDEEDVDDEEEHRNDVEAFQVINADKVKSDERLQQTAVLGESTSPSVITKQFDLLKLSLFQSHVEQLATAETASPELFIGTV